MKLTFKRKFTKALAIGLLVLFVIWIFSPLILKQLLKSQLPNNLILSNIEVSYPSLSGFEISNLEIHSNQNKILVDNIKIPFMGINLIKISSVKIMSEKFLVEEKNEKTNNFLLPFLKPIKLDYSIKIDKFSINDKDFQLQGSINLTSKASQFQGTLLYLQQSMPLEINLLGLNGENSLILSTKLGSDQYLTAEYDWREQQQPQQLKVLASIRQPLWALLKKSNLIPQEIKVEKPEVGFDIILSWPRWPTIKSDIINFKLKGEAQFNFEKINYGSWKIGKNKLRIKSINNHKILLSSDADIITINTSNTKIKPIIQSQLLNAELEIETDRLTVKNTGRVVTIWEGNTIQLTNNFVKLNLLNNNISSKQKITIVGSNKFFKTLSKPSQKIIVESEMSLDFHDSKLQLKFNKNKLELPQLVEFGKLSLNSAAINLDPFEVNYNVINNNPKEIIDNLNITSTIAAQLIYQDKTQTFNLANRCQVNLQQAVMEARCISFPKGLEQEKIEALMVVNLKKEWVEMVFKTASIDAEAFSLSEMVGHNLQLKSGDVSFNIIAKVGFPQLKELNQKNFLQYVSNKSQLTTTNLNLEFEDISLNNAAVKLDKYNANGIKIELAADQLILASGLTFEKITGQFLHQDKGDNEKKLAGFELNFSLLEGKGRFYSNNFEVFNDEYELLADFSDVNLEKLLKWSDIKGLSGTGRLTGTLPVKVDKQGIIIKNGKLSSTEAGIIHYLSNEEESVSDNIALNALQNFHYSELSIKIQELLVNYHKQGVFVVPIRIVGRNPQSQFDNVFAINPTLKGSIPAKAWSHLITGDVKKKLLSK